MTTPTGTALISYEGIDFEPDGNEDIKPSFPVIKMVQATSVMAGSKRHVGEFWHSDYEDYSPSLDVVGLLKRDTRAFFLEGQREPACASNDGITPRADQPYWEDKEQPATCAECPLSVWGDDGTPPPCRQSMVLLVDRNPEGEPDLAQLRIGGMSITPYRRFVGRKLAPKKLPIYTQRLRLSTTEKAEAGKNWMELVIEGEPLPREQVMKYVGILRAERTRFEQSVQHEPEAPAAQTWGDGSESYAGRVDPETGEITDEPRRARSATPRDTRPLEERLTGKAKEMFAQEAEPTD